MMKRKVVLWYRLVIFVLSVNYCDFMAIVEGGIDASWVTGSSPRLVRHVRDLPPRDMMENSTLVDTFDVHVCYAVAACHYDVQLRDFFKTLEDFRFGDVYEKMGSWCAPREDCWDERCKDDSLKTTLGHDEQLVQWICQHPTGFQNSSCAQNPFAEEMGACASRYFRDFNRTLAETVKERASGFKFCVVSALNDLQGCSGENREFFASFFNFALSIKYDVN